MVKLYLRETMTPISDPQSLTAFQALPSFLTPSLRASLVSGIASGISLGALSAERAWHGRFASFSFPKRALRSLGVTKLVSSIDSFSRAAFLHQVKGLCLSVANRVASGAFKTQKASSQCFAMDPFLFHFNDFSIPGHRGPLKLLILDTKNFAYPRKALEERLMQENPDLQIDFLELEDADVENSSVDFSIDFSNLEKVEKLAATGYKCHFVIAEHLFSIQRGESKCWGQTVPKLLKDGGQLWAVEDRMISKSQASSCCDNLMIHKLAHMEDRVKGLMKGFRFIFREENFLYAKTSKPGPK